MASDFRKTIEERAKEAGIISQYKSDYRYDKRSVEYGYTAGATGQREIDIEKAWSLAYSMYQIGRDNLSPLTKDEFIKAMEEQLWQRRYQKGHYNPSTRNVRC